MSLYPVSVQFVAFLCVSHDPIPRFCKTPSRLNFAGWILQEAEKKGLKNVRVARISVIRKDMKRFFHNWLDVARSQWLSELLR